MTHGQGEMLQAPAVRGVKVVGKRESGLDQLARNPVSKAVGVSRLPLVLTPDPVAPIYLIGSFLRQLSLRCGYGVGP